VSQIVQIYHWEVIQYSTVNAEMLKKKNVNWCSQMFSLKQVASWEIVGRTCVYYMASSMSRQGESNPALWLATQAGKTELSCPLGTTRCVPEEKFPWKPYNKSFVDQAYSVKMQVYGHQLRLGPQTHKKRTWPISSHLDLTLGQ